MAGSIHARKILNEILNSDYRDLVERIDQSPEASNVLGMCGESPAHIAIYKDEPKMLSILLEAGANPNIRNSTGDSLLHVAARLGSLECVKLLYETQNCQLEVRNNHNETAVDIAKSAVCEEDLAVTKLYRTWVAKETDDNALMQSMAEGRKKCLAYLLHAIEHDRLGRVDKMVRGTTDNMLFRHHTSRIINGVCGESFTPFYDNYTHPQSAPGEAELKPSQQEQLPDRQKIIWTKDDVDFFSSYYPGIDAVVVKTKAHDYVSNSMRVGVRNVLAHANPQEAVRKFD